MSVSWLWYIGGFSGFFIHICRFIDILVLLLSIFLVVVLPFCGVVCITMWHGVGG